jgi:hypothetical protein
MERLAELLFILASVDRLTLLSDIAIEKYRGRLANTATIGTTALSYFNNHH